MTSDFTRSIWWSNPWVFRCRFSLGLHEIPRPRAGWAHLGMLFGLVAALATASRRVGESIWYLFIQLICISSYNWSAVYILYVCWYVWFSIYIHTCMLRMLAWFMGCFYTATSAEKFFRSTTDHLVPDRNWSVRAGVVSKRNHSKMML